MSNKNIWYLPGPFHQYQEDVKALAKEAGLRRKSSSTWCRLLVLVTTWSIWKS
jgi:hypothetical protein